MPYAFVGAGAAAPSQVGNTRTLSATFAAGETVFVIAQTWQGAPTTVLWQIADGVNTWTEVARVQSGSGSTTGASVIWKADNVAAGTVTLVLSRTDGGFTGDFFNFFRYTGLASGPVQVAGGRNFNPGGSGGVDNLTGVSLTPTGQPAMLLAAAWPQNTGGQPSAGALSNDRGQLNPVSPQGRVEDRRLTSTAAVTPAFTTTSTFEDHEIIAIIVSEAGGSTAQRAAPSTDVSNTGWAASSTAGSQAFPDESSFNRTVTAVGNTRVSTVGPRFGSGSILFDGNGDWLSIPHDPNLAFQGDWTFEAWVLADSLTPSGHVLSKYNTGDPQIAIYKPAGSAAINFYANSNGVIPWNIADAVPVATLVANTWTHIAICKSGNNWRTFQDGVLVSSFTSALSIFTGNTSPLLIGAGGVTSREPWLGRMDEVRLTNAARYTANFTPPSPIPSFASDPEREQVQLLLRGDDSTLSAMLDEVTSSSTDFITTTQAGAQCAVNLSPVADPVSSTGHIVRYRARGDGLSGLEVALLQGSTIIASWTTDPLPTTETLYEQTLTAPQANSITDYSQLRLRFTEI